MKTWTTSAGLQWLEAILHERFGYVFALRLKDNNTLLLTHSGSMQRIELTADGATFSRADSSLPCTQWDADAEGWHTALRPSLSAPGMEKLPTPLITPTSQGLHIGYDILGLTYWMLSRQEEVGRTDLDAHGRFPAVSSHAFKHDYLERPIVDEWLHILGQAIQRVWPELPLKKHHFEMKVSHDVDEPSRYGFRSAFGLIRAMGGDVLKRCAFKNALLGPWIRLNTQERIHPLDPYNTFDWLMDLSERHGLTSAFYFTCGRQGTAYGAGYELDHPAIRNLLRHIHGRGHEIGLHPGYGTYLDSAQIKREAARLRQVCAEEGVHQDQWGGRMHYLQWRQPITLRAWDDAGMAYDSTLTYADHAGFRCGTCFEYPAFDPVAQESLNLRIRPLIVMEGSVFGYMNLGVSDAAGKVDAFVIGKVLDAATLGGYYMAQKIILLIPATFTGIIDQVMFPIYSKFQKEKERVKEGYFKTLSLSALLLLPPICLIFTFADPLVRIMLGKQWVHIIPLVMIMSIFGIFQALGGGIFASVIYSLGRPQLATLVNAFRMAALPVFVIVGSNWGVFGVAWGFALYGVFGRLFNQWLLKYFFDFSLIKYFKSIFPAALSSAIATLPTYLISSILGKGSLWSMISWNIAALLVWGVMYLIFIRLLAKQDLAYFVTIGLPILQKTAAYSFFLRVQKKCGFSCG